MSIRISWRSRSELTILESDRKPLNVGGIHVEARDTGSIELGTCQRPVIDQQHQCRACRERVTVLVYHGQFDRHEFFSFGLVDVKQLDKPLIYSSTCRSRFRSHGPPFGEAHNHNLDWSSDERFACKRKIRIYFQVR